MPSFGSHSKAELSTVDKKLQTLFGQVVIWFDCKISEGIRSLEKQQTYVAQGLSKTLHSKHLKGKAVDVYPHPIKMPRTLKPNDDGMVSIEQAKGYAKDLARFYYFGGFVLGIAKAMGISIRWGGDWDMDTEVNDQTFDDLPHFELED